MLASQTEAVAEVIHAPALICTYCVITGSGFTVITLAAEVDLQPAAFVTSTVYEPAAVAVYVTAVPTCVVPLNHLYDVPVLEVSKTDEPAQNDVDGDDIVGICCADAAVMGVGAEVILQPLLLVMSTVYDPVVFAV